MKPCEEHYRILISGLLDGELDAAQQADLHAHLETCPGCQRELDSLRCLFSGTAAAFGGEEPPEEIWDRFLDGVYNRLERKMGWAFLLAGAALLAAYGTYAFLAEPWGSALLKTLVAMPIIGLALLFVSVLRQRIESLKTDRYTREVHR